MSSHRSECGAWNTTRLCQSRLESSASSFGSAGHRPCLLSITYLKTCSEVFELTVSKHSSPLPGKFNACNFVFQFLFLLFKGCVVGKVEIQGVEGVRRPVVKSLNVSLGSCVTVNGSDSLSEFCFSHLEDGDMNCWVTSPIEPVGTSGPILIGETSLFVTHVFPSHLISQTRRELPLHLLLSLACLFLTG